MNAVKNKKTEINPIKDLKHILGDGESLRIRNYPRKNYKQYEELSIHGHLLYKVPDITKFDEFITPIDQFFIRNHLKAPIINVKNWELSLVGNFEKEVTLNIDDIKKYDQVTRVHLIECTGNQRAEYTIMGNLKSLSMYLNMLSFNQLIRLLDPRQYKWWISFLRRTGLRGGNMFSNGVFTGIKLFDLLKDYPLKKGTKEIIFEGIDKGSETVIHQLRGKDIHYARSFEIKELEKYEPILCFEMNGAPLTTNHGYPVRLIIPGIYGHEQVKWLGRIIATTEKFRGYYQTEYYGYKINGETVPVHEVRPKSAVIKVLKKNNKITVYGIAWRGMSNIERVDVSIDKAKTWRSANLLCKEIDTSWIFWEFVLPDNLKGLITIMPRTYCVNGECQPLKPEKFSAVYGNNSVFTAVVKL